MYPCRLCPTEHEPRALGEHYRIAHKLVVHGCGRGKRQLPDHYITALCDGAVRAAEIIAAEQASWEAG